MSSLGDPGGERTTVLANRSPATPGAWITLSDLASVLQPKSSARVRAGAARRPTQGAAMATASLADVELVVRTIAQVAVDNEKYFGELDAVVGDGDFGYSMARGFELVLRDWDGFDRADIGTFLKKIAVVITSRIGGTSGPIWGTAFLRAGTTAGAVSALEPAQVVAMLRARSRESKARGRSDVGDKTLLDALVPTVDTIEAQIGVGSDAAHDAAGSGGHRARTGRGHPAHAGHGRAGQLHRRAQHRHPRCGRCRRRGDVRSPYRPVAGVTGPVLTTTGGAA